MNKSLKLVLASSSSQLCFNNPQSFKFYSISYPLKYSQTDPEKPVEKKSLADKANKRVKLGQKLKTRMTSARKDVDTFKNEPKLIQSTDSLLGYMAAKSFPVMKGVKDLNGNKVAINKILNKSEPALVMACMKPFYSEKQILEWRSVFEEKCPNFKAYELNIIEDPAWRWFGFLAKFARKMTLGKKNDIRSKTFYYFQRTNPFDGVLPIHVELEMKNIASVFIFLIKDGKIRWKSSGFPEEKEYKILGKLVDDLDKE